MRFLRRLALFTAMSLAFFAAAGAAADQPLVEVQKGDWGDADVQDIQAVLNSVAGVLAPHFPQHASSRLVVAFSAAGPRVLGRKSSDGAHIVLLNVRDRRWDQFAYQFSHELCHIFSNYDERPIHNEPVSREHQWFEETLCETVSLVVLNRLALSWNASPPRAGWESYASAFGEYAARLLNNDHRRAPGNESLAALYLRHRTAVAANPYLRQRNEQFATALLGLFESSPESLEAIGYLNFGAPPGQDFAAYLTAWHDCCPEQHRPFVRRLIALFAAA